MGEVFVVDGPGGSYRVPFDRGANLVRIDLPSRPPGQPVRVYLPETVELQHNQRLDEDSRLLIWSDEASRAKNYYLNSFGRNQVSMPWRVEESYSYFERFEPGDYTFR